MPLNLNMFKHQLRICRFFISASNGWSKKPDCFEAVVSFRDFIGQSSLCHFLNRILDNCFDFAVE